MIPAAEVGSQHMVTWHETEEKLIPKNPGMSQERDYRPYIPILRILSKLKYFTNLDFPEMFSDLLP